jgi:hypothetical protein
MLLPFQDSVCAAVPVLTAVAHIARCCTACRVHIPLLDIASCMIVSKAPLSQPDIQSCISDPLWIPRKSGPLVTSFIFRCMRIGTETIPSGGPVRFAKSLANSHETHASKVWQYAFDSKKTSTPSYPSLSLCVRFFFDFVFCDFSSTGVRVAAPVAVSPLTASALSTICHPTSQPALIHT